MKIQYIKNDFKQVVREPIMLLLFIFPMFIGIIIKLMLTFLVPFINHSTFPAVKPAYN